MKKSITLLFAASTLFLAGCCTTHRTVSYDHVIMRDLSDGDLNRMGYEGWRVVGFGKDETQNAGHTITILEKPSK
jgi:predicted small secreted protein